MTPPILLFTKKQKSRRETDKQLTPRLLSLRDTAGAMSFLSDQTNSKLRNPRKHLTMQLIYILHK